MPRQLLLLILVAAPLSAQTFAGTVRIEGQPADSGVEIETVVFRADRSLTGCGYARVAAAGKYRLTVYAKPECRTPGDSYEFYVNGVWALSRPAASPPSVTVPADLNVPLAALRPPYRPGVRLVWFFGSVTDGLNRPAAPGLRVVASPPGPAGPSSACVGTGVTQDVFWTPKTPGAQPVNVKGFFLIGVEMAAECQDTNLVFELTAASGIINPGPVAMSTPPYGRAFRKNLVLKTN